MGGGQDTKDKSSANKLDWEFGIFPDSLHKESMTEIYRNENWSIVTRTLSFFSKSLFKCSYQAQSSLILWSGLVLSSVIIYSCLVQGSRTRVILSNIIKAVDIC